MCYLVTGFEPFGGASVNPSWEAVSRLPDAVDGHPVYRLMLPTVFQEAADLLRAEIARLSPSAVICCGVAGGRQAVTPELVAINYRMARIPDNAGQSFSGVPIDEHGDAAYMTQLPVHDIVAAMKAADIPAYLSLSAGAYVCNDVYYALLRSQAELGHKGLFIHVPEADVLDFDRVAQALTIALQVIGKA